MFVIKLNYTVISDNILKRHHTVPSTATPKRTTTQYRDPVHIVNDGCAISCSFTRFLNYLSLRVLDYIRPVTTFQVNFGHRVISAVGEHVISQNTLAGGGKGIGINEPAYFGIVITALEVIEFGFGDTLLATTYKMPCEIASCTHTISIQQGCGNATIYSSKHEKSFGYTNNLH